MSKKIKYHYVMRYLNGESPTELGAEINLDVKEPTRIVLQWARQYYKHGIEGLESKSGKGKANGKGNPKKKPKPNYDKMTREELIEHLKIKDVFIDEINKKTKPRFKYPIVDKIKSIFDLSIYKICAILFISKSGYYKWKRNPKVTSNYDSCLLKKVETTYKKHRGLYGAQRIMGSILREEGKKYNIKTIIRYMKFLNISSKIRNPTKRSKKSKEIKDTKDIRKNYIRGDFRSNTNRVKLFSDTTEYKIKNYKLYFSAVIGANKNLYSLNVSLRNNQILVMKDVSEATKKVGSKFYIQFDNAMFYKSEKMEELVSKHKGITSFGKAWESKANWPIENFWSILKQEFLREYKPNNLLEAQKLLRKIIFTYNHKRIQKNLEWKTPAEARV